MRVAYDAARNLILVTDSKDPKSAPIEWSRDMWESSVWTRIVEGHLPAGCREVGVDYDPHALRLPGWGGGPVEWGGLRFTAEEWEAFLGRVEAGELSVEAITGG